MDPLMPLALQVVREVKTTMGGPTYDQFCHTLKQYRHRIIDSSTVISTLHQLFHGHQTLLHSFQPFFPVPTHPAPPPEDPNVRRCLDFLNRVGSRFYGGPPYANFLDCVLAYARAEMTASDLRHEALQLFGEDDDLLGEFLRFLPEPCVGEKRRRGSNYSSSPDDEEMPRWLLSRNRYGGATAAKRRVDDKHHTMSDLMCEVDVKIENLKTCIEKAEELHGDLSRGRLYPAEVHLEEHFTQLNLAYIRMFARKFLEVRDKHMVRTLSELKKVLVKKKERLERERLKIVQEWNRIRQPQ